jgi:hypothetical protein
MRRKLADLTAVQNAYLTWAQNIDFTHQETIRLVSAAESVGTTAAAK